MAGSSDYEDFVSFIMVSQKVMSLFTSVCGGHLAATSAEQHIYSHARFGDGNYGNKEDCDWIVEAPPGKNVHLSFRIFEMEDEQGGI